MGLCRLRLVPRIGKKRITLQQEEFEHIAHDLRRRALNTAFGYGLDSAAADDVAQDTLLKMWAMRAEIDPGRKVEALAVSIARHLCIDGMRRRHTVPIAGRQMIDDHHEQPDTALENDENRRWLERRLAQLPTNEHAVLKLRQVERKSDAEIAAILGISLSSVPTLLSRARHKLLDEIRRRNG